MKVRIVALMLMASACAAPSWAQKAPAVQGPLAAAKGLKCSFPVFAAARWTDTPPTVINGPQSMSIAIDALDYRRGRARFGGESSATLVTMLLTTTGMTLIEQTTAGNVTVTTIFSDGGTGSSLLAVHSRHLGGIDAKPTPSQSYGSCQVTS